MNKPQHIAFGITGASGMPIALALLKHLLHDMRIVHLVITQAAFITLKQETDLDISSNPNIIKSTLIAACNAEHCAQNLRVYTYLDWYAPLASGNSVIDAMVICPCSMATLGQIAHGIGDDLITRGADVMLKERKNLVLVPRETPLSTLHLSNMQQLSSLGVCILPPVIEFYTKPNNITDIINSIVARILKQLNVDITIIAPWGS